MNAPTGNPFQKGPTLTKIDGEPASVAPMGNIEKLLYEMAQQREAALGGTAPQLDPNGTSQAQQQAAAAAQEPKPVSVEYNFAAIPDRLKVLPQWVLWKYEYRKGKWDKVPYIAGMTKRRADTTKPSDWRSFESVVTEYNHGGYDGIGHVLTAASKVVIIDCDDKPAKPATEEERKMFSALYNTFSTYTELSVSGRGMHIVCEGVLPDNKGRRHGSLEVYAAERYMAFTGNTDLSSLPFIPQGCEVVTTIEDCQSELDQVIASLGTPKQSALAATDEELDVPETKTYQQIWDDCLSQSNNEKFQMLWDGQWELLGYKSQSEPDMGLIEFFRNAGGTIEQVMTMFRSSKLYRPPPEKAANYVRRTVRNAFRIALAEKHEAEVLQAQFIIQSAALEEEVRAEEHASSQIVPMDYPPGKLGELARMFYSQSVLPNQQISITAAFSFMTAICGLSWQTPTKTGLNLYQILIAASGIGKEAQTTQPASLYRHVIDGINMPKSFEDPFYTGVVSSGQALTKLTVEKRCVTVYWNEIGKLVKDFENPSQVAAGIKSTLLRSYPKSGMQSTFGGVKYAQEINNVEDPGACSLSVFGDVTPEELFPSINYDSSTDGVLSRIDFIQVFGKRPLMNDNSGHAPFPTVLQWAQALTNEAVGLRNKATYRQVDFGEAKSLLHEFEIYCTDKINTLKNGFVQQLYVRLHIKALKYSSILAVADNCYAPSITTAHAEWAIAFCKNQVAMFEARVAGGDVGSDDNAREQRIIDLVREYYKARPTGKDEGVSKAMYDAKVIPTSYFSENTKRKTAFKGHILGANAALKKTLFHMVECGKLMQLEKADAVKLGFSHRALLYRIGTL